MTIKIRASQDRGKTDFGWLKSYHSFSFGSYFDPNHHNFGSLRVINEDIISAQSGFEKHPHRDMEIITVVISGEITHQDSINNSKVIKAGEVQIMSAGSGIYHSEFNLQKNASTHLLQIWITPKIKNVEPRYQQKDFSRNLRKNSLNLIISNFLDNCELKIYQDAKIYLSDFNSEKEISYDIENNHKIWLQVISGELQIDDKIAAKGDGIMIENEKNFKIKTLSETKFLLFDLA
jgi:hypothetical protein